MKSLLLGIFVSFLAASAFGMGPKGNSSGSETANGLVCDDCVDGTDLSDVVALDAPFTIEGSSVSIASHTRINGNLSSTGSYTQSGTSVNTFTGAVAISTTAGLGQPVQNAMYADLLPRVVGKITYSGGVPSCAWCVNVSSITDLAAARIGISFSRDFANTNYACVGNTFTASAAIHVGFEPAAGYSNHYIEVQTRETTLGNANDAVDFFFACFGAQ